MTRCLRVQQFFITLFFFAFHICVHKSKFLGWSPVTEDHMQMKHRAQGPQNADAWFTQSKDFSTSQIAPPTCISWLTAVNVLPVTLNVIYSVYVPSLKPNCSEIHKLLVGLHWIVSMHQWLNLLHITFSITIENTHNINTAPVLVTHDCLVSYSSSGIAILTRQGKTKYLHIISDYTTHLMGITNSLQHVTATGVKNSAAETWTMLAVDLSRPQTPATYRKFPLFSIRQCYNLHCDDWASTEWLLTGTLKWSWTTFLEKERQLRNTYVATYPLQLLHSPLLR